MVNSAELNGTMEYLTVQPRCRVKRCCYNRVLSYSHNLGLPKQVAQVKNIVF